MWLPARFPSARQLLKTTDMALYVESFIAWVVFDAADKPVNVLGSSLLDQFPKVGGLPAMSALPVLFDN